MTLNTILLQGAAGDASGVMNILMIVALVVIFWLFMIRPQQKKQKEINKFRESLDKGDKIITAGGIHGKITNVKGNSFMVEIARDVVITVDKGSVYPSVDDAKQAPDNENVKK